MFTHSLNGPSISTALLTFAILVTSACTRSPGELPREGTLRVVSLSPAITQMIRDLGFADRIVAASAYDPVRPEPALVVGDLYRLDYEKLLAARPTHIFMQPGQPGVPATMERLAKAHGWHLFSYRIEEIRDVFAALSASAGDSASPSVGHALGVAPDAVALAAKIQRQLAQLSEVVASQPQPHVLLLVGLNPLTGVGPHTFLHEMLIIAGGHNALDGVAHPYPVLDKERLLRLAPDVIVVISPSERPAEGAPEPTPSYLADFPVPAAEQGRILHLTDRVALLPSTSMARIAGQLARLLHPDLSARIDALLEEGEKR